MIDTKIKLSESQIQKGILDYLKIRNDCTAFRLNTMGVPLRKNDGTQSFRPAPSRGIPDIVVLTSIAFFPVTIWLEVKSRDAKQNDSQKYFESIVNEYKGFYYVVRSISDVESIFESLEDNVASMVCKIQ